MEYYTIDGDNKIEKEYYTIEEIMEYYNKIEKPDLTLDELVLLVLGLIADKPINGRVVLHKEIFLIYKELSDNAKVRIVNPKFVKYRYGAFSFYIALSLEYLEEDGFITVTNKHSLRNAMYMLTDKGRRWSNKIINELERRLGKDYINNLRRLRIGLDQLGHEGIIRYVRENYPEYYDKNARRRDYANMDWGGLVG
jgi:predicted transcriptional regulator